MHPLDKITKECLPEKKVEHEISALEKKCERLCLLKEEYTSWVSSTIQTYVTAKTTIKN